MAKFEYEVADRNGVVLNGEMLAFSRDEAYKRLTQKKFTVIRLRDVIASASGGSLKRALLERITLVERMFLARNLATAIKAGLSLVETLYVLILDTKNNVLRRILIEAKDNLENGAPLSTTLANYPQHFSSVYTGMIRAGEVSGQMDKVLDELVDNSMREYELKKKVRSALAYPVVLILASFGVIALFMFFILPRLARTFTSSQVEIPLITQVLINVSNFFVSQWILDIVLVLILIGAVIFMRRTALGKRAFSWFVFHLPLIREMVKKIALVRFTKTLSSLITTGIPITDSLNLAADSVGNYAYRQAIRDSIKKMEAGVTFSKAFDEYPELFPRFLISMMVVGEKSGTLDHILKTFSDFYNQEIESDLRDFVALIEPALIVLIGLFVGVIAFSVLIPVYQVVGRVGVR